MSKIKIKMAWSWLIDGLTEAVATCQSMFSSQPVHRISLDANRTTLRNVSGRIIGQIAGTGEESRFELEQICPSLKGALIDMIMPQKLVLHRELNPIAAESLEFLDAYARHQIERVTPWKVVNTLFGVTTAPLGGASGKLAVTLHVVARPLVSDLQTAFKAYHIGRLRLVIKYAEDGGEIIVPVDEKRDDRTRMRHHVSLMVLGSFCLLACSLWYLSWQVIVLKSKTNAIATRIAQQEDTIGIHGDGDGAVLDAQGLFTLRDSKRRAVETLEAVSNALPDDTYLVSLRLSDNKLNISGISKRTAGLVPALEGSKQFLDVSFSDATTRLENGIADQFHLSMRIADTDKTADVDKAPSP